MPHTVPFIQSLINFKNPLKQVEIKQVFEAKYVVWNSSFLFFLLKSALKRWDTDNDVQNLEGVCVNKGGLYQRDSS